MERAESNEGWHAKSATRRIERVRRRTRLHVTLLSQTRNDKPDLVGLTFGPASLGRRARPPRAGHRRRAAISAARTSIITQSAAAPLIIWPARKCASFMEIGRPDAPRSGAARAAYAFCACCGSRRAERPARPLLLLLLDPVLIWLTFALFASSHKAALRTWRLI